jgi:hypothetical protein
MELQYREFIRNFKKYKEKNILILGRHSCVIGRWTGRDGLKAEDTVMKVCAPKRKGLEILAENGIGIKPVFAKVKCETPASVAARDLGIAQEEQGECPLCVKCSKPAVGEFEQYDWDSGEAKSFDLCKKCSKGFSKKI